MDRSECFQMFVYLLCSHYKTVYSGTGSFPVVLFPQEGGRGLEDLMEVWWALRCTLPRQPPNKCERAQGCCQKGKKLLYFRYFALKAVPPDICNNSRAAISDVYSAHREAGRGPEAAE